MSPLNGYTGLLGQATVPTAPALSGLWDPKTGQFDLNAVLKQLQDSQTQANTGNVTRYNDLLTAINGLQGQVVGPQGTYGQAMGQLDTTGQAVQQQIANQTLQNQASGQQGLVSRGLGNTTIGENIAAQTANQGQLLSQQASEATAQQKVGLLENQANAQMNIGGMQQRGIESLNQQAPNMQLYSDMIKQATQGQAANKAAANQQAAIQQQGWSDYEKRMQSQGTSLGNLGGESSGGTSMGGGIANQGGGGGGGTYVPSGAGGSFYGPTGGGMSIGPDLSQPGTVIGGAGQPAMAGGTGLDQWSNLSGAAGESTTSGAGVPEGTMGQSMQVPTGAGATPDQITNMTDQQAAQWAGVSEEAQPAAKKKRYLSRSELMRYSADALRGSKQDAGGYYVME